MKALAHLNKYLFQYKWRLILGVLFIIASNIFAIYAPRLVREAFDLITVALEAYRSGDVSNFEVAIPEAIALAYRWLGQDAATLGMADSLPELAALVGKLALILAVLYFVVAIFKGIFLFFTRQTIIVTSRMIEFDLKNEVFDHYQKLSLSFYRRNNTGDLMNRISEDVTFVRMYLGPAIMYSINLLVLSVLAVGAMVSVNPELTLYVLLPLPILSISIYHVSRLINQRSARVQTQQSRLSTLVQETFSGIRVLKAYNRQEAAKDNFAEASNEYKTLTLDLVRVEALFMPAIILLIGLSTIITIYVGGIKAIAGEITIGNIAEFVIYVNMLTWPFASIGWVTSLVQRAAASQTRINEFLQTEPEIQNHKETPDDIRGEIVFDNVSYLYSDSGIEALKNVSFEIPVGQTLAIIGRTGSGKSTIANLVCRNLEATGGEVRIDGKPIDELNLDSLHGSIGYVPQDVFLFSDTIANNIAFGLEPEEATPEIIEQAARDADVLENIQGFPKGFETMLGERGINLSGGQKQRVSIARAIARRPEILIFDDCLSAVDTETEEVILDNLQRIMKNRTTLLISHRVSTVKSADQILVLDNGEIVERGTHQELLDMGGEYESLHQKQLLEEGKEIE